MNTRVLNKVKAAKAYLIKSKFIIAVSASFFLLLETSYAQGVGINTDGAAPHSSAVLDVKATDKGMLIPRMTTSQRNSVLNPAIGLIIFNISNNCLNYFSGTEWQDLCGINSDLIGEISSLDCASHNSNGNLTQGILSTNFTSTLFYTGGNGGLHSGQAVQSTGVTGLTAVLNSDFFANGVGMLSYSILGTPNSSGVALFLLQIGGQSCTLELTVNFPYPSNSIHCSQSPTEVIDVLNPVTGRVWMDRNLGAIQVANSSADGLAHGDLYQFGRRSDGHQCRNSATNNNLSSTLQPNHNNFILTGNQPFNWTTSVNTANLWSGTNGVNNPCPFGYRLPTVTEFTEEINSWNSANSIGAFQSPLKLTLAGWRNLNIPANVNNVNIEAFYWSSNINDFGGSRSLFFDDSTAIPNFSASRAYGYSVRCIKN